MTWATPVLTPISAVTNEFGEYRFTNLRVGLYTLQVDLEGFTQHNTSVIIRSSVTSVENIQLELAEVSGEVTIVADGVGLNLTDAAPPAAFTRNTLQNLPLVNERFQDALPLVPGVVRGA